LALWNFVKHVLKKGNHPPPPSQKKMFKERCITIHGLEVASFWVNIDEMNNKLLLWKLLLCF
jgi:hypothetical protein